MPGYISEFSYSNTGGGAFVEIAVPAGTDVSGYTLVVYSSNGRVDDTYTLDTSTGSSAGQDIYIIQNEPSGSFPVVGTDTFALVDDTGNVVQFIGQSAVTARNGPADGMTSNDVGQAPGSTSLQSDDGGATYYQQMDKNPGTIPCYSPGTLIDTPDGPRAVESLIPGDMVLTCDHGPQPIRWIHSGDHPLEDVDTDAKPVLVKAGALGQNLPAQDLIVSRQHRILVGGVRHLQAIFPFEAFAPAKSLTSLPGIRHMKGKKEMTWIHFACDRHEIITANGCLSESLLLGPMVVNGFSARERRTLTDIFGPAAPPDSALNGPPARECLTVGEVRRQITNHRKKLGRRVAKEVKKWDADLAMERYDAERMREVLLRTHAR